MLPCPRILCSYHYFKRDDLSKKTADYLGSTTDLDVFFDSGAYSAWTQGKAITVREYADWLKKWGHLCACAAALDVLGDAQASFDQTEELRQLLGTTAYPIVPVFHSNDAGGFARLERYLKAGYDYIGISPTGAIYGNPKLYQAWLTHAFAMRPPNVRYHGFGVTSWNAMRSHQWYSVDSTSWTSCFRFASLALFDMPRGVFVKIDLRDPKSILSNAALLATYHLDAAAVRADRMGASRVLRDRLHEASLTAWQLAEEFLNKHRGANPMKVYLGISPGESGNASLGAVGRAMRARAQRELESA